MTRAKPQTWAETPATHRAHVLVGLRGAARHHREVGLRAVAGGFDRTARHHARREAAYLAAVRVLEDAAPKRGAKR